MTPENRGKRGPFRWINYPESPVKLALLLSLPLMIVLAGLFLTIIHWEKKSIADIQQKNTLLYARALFQHIVTSPIWRSSHNGYYVEITEHAERGNLLSIMGKTYVRVDPAIFGPRLNTLLRKRATYRFHLTSLESQSRLPNPDRWELSALRKFRNGSVTEEYQEAAISGKSYFRYIAPVQMQENCLRCHRNLTAGLSIDIPVDFADRLYAAQVKRSALSFGTFGLFILLFVLAITIFFSKKISDAFRSVRRLNAQLRELSARDARIIENIVDGIVIINHRGYIEMVNPAFARFLGRETEEFIDRRMDEVEEDQLRDLLTAPSGEEVEYNGHIFTVSEVDIRDDTREISYGKLKILHDATREKLKATVELAGATAHEMRQPLSVIMTLIPVIREKTMKGEPLDEELRIFESQCGRINEIISRMLNITHYRVKQYTEGKKIFDLSDPDA
jgi:PAS domain S-box-containing protein